MKSSFKTFNKKIISLALVAVMLICTVPFSSSIDYSSWFTVEADAVDYSEYDDAVEAMKASIDEISEAETYPTDDDGNKYYVIDILSCEIDLDDRTELFEAFALAYPTEYAVIYLYSLSWIYFTIGGVNLLGKIILTESDVSLSEFDKRVETLQGVVDELLTYVEGMSDFETIAFFHDYLILNSYYDTTYSIYNAYIILVEGYGVCQAYAYAYQLLLHSAGINCLYVTSDSMNHGWNLVELDGEWYHVDVTWDDPNSDTITESEDYEEGTEGGYSGRLKRQFFLLNDEEIEAMDPSHYEWTVAYESTSTAYSNMPRYTNVIQTYANDSWYYYKDGTLYSCDIDGSNISTVTSRNGYGIAVYGDYYIYGDGEDIKAQSMTDFDIQTIYTLPDETENSYKYFTFFVQGENLYYYYDLSANIKYLDSDYGNNIALLTLSAIECESPVSLSMLNTSEDTSETTTETTTAATTETTTVATTVVTTAATTETTTETTTAATTETTTAATTETTTQASTTAATTTTETTTQASTTQETTTTETTTQTSTTETTTSSHVSTESDSSGCDCICHSTSGFEQFFYKIALFFWQLFNMNQTCACGIEHY